MAHAREHGQPQPRSALALPPFDRHARPPRHSLMASDSSAGPPRTPPDWRRKTAAMCAWRLSLARVQRLLGVLGLEEYAVGDDTGDGLIGSLDLDLGAELCVLDRDHRVADIAIQAR